MGETNWRTEPTTVETLADELWLAEKFQSNSAIAGSPRNSFRTSVDNEFVGGKALNGLGGDKLTELYQTKNVVEMLAGSQTTSNKIRGQKGNSPDPQLRSRIHAKWKTM